MKHTCVSKLTILGSDNVLSSGWCQAINWPNSGISLIWTLATYFSEILSKIQTFSFRKMHFEMSLNINVMICPPECSEWKTTWVRVNIFWSCKFFCIFISENPVNTNITYILSQMPYHILWNWNSSYENKLRIFSWNHVIKAQLGGPVYHPSRLHFTTIKGCSKSNHTGPLIISLVTWITEIYFLPWVSEWLNLTNFLGTVDSKVHIVHISHI